uniref:Metalloendopeptidase n=1 Tax=Parastrongyloides trichosuri TaxID=131310 RepID=A0A0N4ZIY2_PARTI
TYEAIINDTTRRWPNAEGKNYPEIDYYIDWWADYSEVRAAFRELAHYTCIKFNRVGYRINGKNHGINVLYYTKSCRTEYSGMNPNGPNVIYIGDNCYGSNVFVQSLIMQVLGLEAEHNRRDRDNYVKIYPENLQPHFAKFFKKDRINTTVTYNIQYDYGSVIHGSQFI